MKYGSLFSGIGGFDAGFDAAGLACAWQVEQDIACLRVLNRRWPDVPKLNDVRLVDEKSVESVDLICGGFPCQDVSVAGLRKGLSGERSGLWFEFLRILQSLKPRWAVIENVPGLLSSNGGKDFAVILRGLVECGYGVCWRILDAQYFGVPQRRRRVFIVGSLGSGRAAKVLFESEGLFGDTPTRREAGEGIAGTLKGGTGQRGYPDPSDGNGGGLIASTLTSNGDAHSGFKDENGLISIPKVASTLGANDWKGIGHNREQNVIAFNWQAGNNQTTLNADSEKTGCLQVGQQPAVAFAERVVNTLRAGAGMPKHQADESKLITEINSGVRRLTPVECERLQGFPDGWTAGESDSSRYRMLGNAVAVPVAHWIGRRIMEVA